MAAASRLKYLYLAYLSTPACDRTLYRHIRKERVERIVELGLRNARRSLRMIQVAQSASSPEKVRYTGIDLFELRARENPGISLKQAHCLLRASGAKVQVAPGDPHSALSRLANTLLGTDLLVISADQDPQSLQRAWFYVPRMLHERSLVLIEDAVGGAVRLRRISREEIDRLAAWDQRRAA